MKKWYILLVLLVVLNMSMLSEATTYYARPDGGTPTQCNGMFDAPNPDFSGQKNCAFKHPWYATGYNYDTNHGVFVAGKMVGGDTLIADGSFMFGYDNKVLFPECYYGWPYDCHTKALPSGLAGQPTRILGKGWDTGCTKKAEFWGTEKTSVLYLSGSSNIELKCLDLTDHEDCTEFHGCNRDVAPYGMWAGTGLIASDSSNVLLENVDVHGFAHTGIHAGRLTNWTMNNVLIRGNGWVGWDGDIGANISSNSGTIKFINSSIEYNGCAEGYPDKTTVLTCRGQSGGGYGDGLGTHSTGGNWIFENTDFIANTSDGLDLLYMNSAGTVSITGGTFEHNAGNQIKTNSITTLTGALVGGDCAYFTRAGFPDTVGVDSCRAMGNAISLGCQAKPQTLSNLTVTGEGDVLLLAGSGCNTTINVSNSSFTGGLQYGAGGDMVAFYYPDNSNPTLTLTNVSIKDTKDCSNYPTSCNASTCVPNGSCSAPTPNCGQTTNGVDNCGTACSKTGAPCPCVPDGTCSALPPTCGQTTTGVDSCNNPCTKTGIVCPCVPDGSCSAATPACEKTTVGVDNCGNTCSKVGAPCTITFTTLTTFEKWLTTTTIQGAQTAPIIKGIRTGTSSLNYKYYKITIEVTTP